LICEKIGGMETLAGWKVWGGYESDMDEGKQRECGGQVCGET